MVVPARAIPSAARKVLLECRRASASAPFVFAVPAFEFVLLAVLVVVGVCKAESGKLSGVIDGGAGGTGERKKGHAQETRTSRCCS